MKVLVCGDRKWQDTLTIKHELMALQEQHGRCLLVITGGADGADSIGNMVAKELGIDRCIFPANWEGRGLRAGFVRNELMLRIGNPDLVLAFHNFLPNSKGTKMMVKLAESRGVEARVIKSERMAASA